MKSFSALTVNELTDLDAVTVEREGENVAGVQ